MTNKPVPDPLAQTLKTYCNFDAFTSEFPDNMKAYLNDTRHPERATEFKRQLASAILFHTVSPAQYEALTLEDFDTPEDLEKWLRELWIYLYGDEPVTRPAT